MRELKAPYQRVGPHPLYFYTGGSGVAPRFGRERGHAGLTCRSDLQV